MTILLMLLGLFALVLINVPIAVALGVVTATAMLIVQGTDILPNIALVMYDGATKFPLIAIPLFIQTILIFALGYGAAKVMGLSYENAAPAAMIGASNHFEVAIATSVMLFGLSSGAALATVVGVLIEVPVMLMLVGWCKRTQSWFD